MTLVLAIDTSTDRTSVGIIRGTEVIAQFHHDDPLAHGEVLPKLVANLLRQIAMQDLGAIDLVAIGMGPGPFTGLRVGIAFGQAFALAREIPWIGVNSLRAIADTHLELQEEDFLVAIDARRREFFVQKFQEGAPLGEIEVVQREELDEMQVPIYLESPTPLSIARLAQQAQFNLAKDEPDSVTEPIYIRKPDAYPAPKGVKFRPWISTDLVSIYALEQAAYPDDPWSMAQFKEEYAAKSRIYLVAESDGEIVGYAGAMVVGDATDILTLTVSEKFRRRGIARELLKRLIDWSRNQKVDAVMLEMRKGNYQAEPLYKASGFRKISERIDYYGPGVDALVFRKELRK